MLAIVCGCEKFDQFIYGHTITVETDHKPLVSISQKPIHSAPKHLQRMLLQMQRYEVNITYKKGSQMYLVDALSRAFPDHSVPLSQLQSEFCHAVEALDLMEHLPISSNWLKQIQEATNADSTLQVFKEQIQSGWPEHKHIPYSYKFLRDVYFVNATNSAFSRFYFRGPQDFELVDYVRTIIKYKISRT